MKTTKKLTLNKETIAHLNRTEGRTVIGGAVALTADVKGCAGPTRMTKCNQATCAC